MAATIAWRECMVYGVAGTGTTDTREAITGDYNQSGTTVTRTSGARDFTAADVGKLIKFGSGEESKISAFSSATVVTVVETRTVTTTSITLYHVNQARLTTETKRSNTYPTFTFDDGTASQTTILDAVNAKITLRRTYDFTAEVGSVTIAEIGVANNNATSVPAGTFSQTGVTVTRTSGAGTFSAGDVGKLLVYGTGQVGVIASYVSTTSVTLDRSQSVGATTIALEAPLFSRIKLASPIALLVDQQLRFTYNLTLQVAGVPGVTQSTVEGDSTGWPVLYNVSNITTNGAKMVVTTSAAHHFAVGSKVNLSGTVMPRTAITAASSTVSDFTITAAGHGKSPGDSIVIQGVTPSGYNGTFTVASVVVNNITVTSALNPGTGTVFGTVRLADPTPWFNQEWIVSAVPTSTTWEATTAITPPTPHLPEGLAFGNVKRKFTAVNYGIQPITAPTTTIERLAGAYENANTSGSGVGINDGKSSDLLLLQIYHPTVATDQMPAQPTVFPSNFPSHWHNTSALHAGGTETGRSAAEIRFSSTTTTYASAHRKYSTPAAYVRGSFYQDNVHVFAAADFDYSSILFVGLGSRVNPNTNSCVQGYFLFEERQRKSSLHKLTLTVRRRWARDLSVEP
ncbi:MAG: hypothetical protein ACKV19_29390 [Verrucomicrobiales bacterium]